MAGPHEVLGMARHLGLSTTEFHALYTDNGGTTLRFDEAGRCVFLDGAACRVHPRRPLVCRLYPLGRSTDGAGGEKFARFPKEEGCEGTFGTAGTVAGFLESQGVGPYVDWSVRYAELYRRMLGLLDRLGVEGRVETEAAPAPVASASPSAAGGPEDRSPISPWQDIDASLAGHGAAEGVAVPESVEDAIALHLGAMAEWLDGLERRVGGKKPEPEGGKR